MSDHVGYFRLQSSTAARITAQTQEGTGLQFLGSQNYRILTLSLISFQMTLRSASNPPGITSLQATQWKLACVTVQCQCSSSVKSC